MNISEKALNKMRGTSAKLLLMKLSICLMFGLYLPVINDVCEKLVFVFPVGAAIIILCSFKTILKRMTKRKDCWLMLLFCMAYAGTILINAQHNIVQNIKSIVWIGIYIVLFYLWEEETEAEYHKNIIGLNNTVIILSFITNFVSVCMFCVGFYVEYESALYGITCGRLYGVYGNNINSGSVFALCAIWASILNLSLLKKHKELTTWRKWKNFYLVCIFFAYIYIIGSGTRTVRVCIVLSVMVYVCGLIYRRVYSKKVLVRIVVTLLAMVVVAGATEGVNSLTKVVMEFIAPEQSTQIQIPTLDNWWGVASDGEDNQSGEKDEQDIPGDTSALQRDEEQAELSLTAREIIWEQSLLLWRDTNPIFGIGNGNMKIYAENSENKENYSHLVGGTIGESTHSMPVAVLLFSGVVGFGIVFIFLMGRFVKIAVVYFRDAGNWKKEDTDAYLASACLVISLFLYSFMITCILFSNIVESILFWLYLGIMQTCCLRGVRKKK